MSERASFSQLAIGLALGGGPRFSMWSLCLQCSGPASSQHGAGFPGDKCGS